MAACEAPEAAGHGPMVTRRTDLRLDPYFSATKIGWILDNVKGARARAEAGELAFGTVDSFLLWRLTGGHVYASDATNASRTMLCDLETGQWDLDLLSLFAIPASTMPEIRGIGGVFDTTTLLGGESRIRGIAGDQQAALVGQACLSPGIVKVTYGTGVQWLSDGLGLIGQASEMDGLAAPRPIPRSTCSSCLPSPGLGAPHWSSHACATLFGMIRGTTRRKLARAELESVAYRTRDLLDAMRQDAGLVNDIVLRVDGVTTNNDWTMQFLADMLGLSVERPHCLETTAPGVGYLAGLDARFYPEPADFQKRGALERLFAQMSPDADRVQKWAGWQTSVAQSLPKG